ncbi:MAG TPA: ACT domain-containing protein [Actinomycetota bacterium]|nr:ACT domain-containing protein [Actinomycetota bacterium]
MRHFAVSVIGDDRPGIIAAVSGALVDRGCNIEDASSTILRGHFTMVLVISAPEDLAEVTDQALETAIREATSQMGLIVAVRPIGEIQEAHKAPAEHLTSLSVYGSDRPGIVHGFTSLLAGRGINIVDLSTRLVGQPGDEVYAMTLDLAVPSSADVDELMNALSALADQLQVEFSLHEADADIL